MFHGVSGRGARTLVVEQCRHWYSPAGRLTSEPALKATLRLPRLVAEYRGRVRAGRHPLSDRGRRIGRAEPRRLRWRTRRTTGRRRERARLGTCEHKRGRRPPRPETTSGATGANNLCSRSRVCLTRCAGVQSARVPSARYSSRCHAHTMTRGPAHFGERALCFVDHSDLSKVIDRLARVAPDPLPPLRVRPESCATIIRSRSPLVSRT